ncbi:hypothetical protein [Pleomorphomonas sp. PLEO]|uniref:hypothetical protein n=1 Tax=Pleomorphomonas sp. PLEO TaxID=3239306 RepID=UPI00351E13C4
MAVDHDQAAKDAWQATLYDTVYEFSVALKKLHETNPWPEYQVVPMAIDTLATELWDRCFSLTEITTAFVDAAADLPRYAGGKEVRP